MAFMGLSATAAPASWRSSWIPKGWSSRTPVAILMLAPRLAPMAGAFGCDKVGFGIIMRLHLETGHLTPPVGMNLIVAMTAFKQPSGLLCRAAVPDVLLLLVGLALVVWQSWAATGLPH